MASPLVGLRARPCPQCGSAEVYLRVDGAPQCRDCKWTGVPLYDSKYLQSWSTLHIPPDASPAVRTTPRRIPGAARRSGLLLGAGGAVCIAAIPGALLLARYVYPILGLAIPVPDLLLPFPLKLIGVSVLIVLGVVGLLGAGIAFRGNASGAEVFAAVGVGAAIVSVVLFGVLLGIIGVVGGALLAGGGVAMRRFALTLRGPLATA